MGESARKWARTIYMMRRHLESLARQRCGGEVVGGLKKCKDMMEKKETDSPSHCKCNLVEPCSDEHRH